MFLFGIALMATLTVVVNSQQTYAESIFDRLNCTVGSLLNRNCPPAPSQQQPSQNTPQQQPSQTSPSTRQTTTENKNGEPAEPGSPSTTEPLTLDEALLEELPAVPSLEPQLTTSSSDVSYAAFASPLGKSGGTYGSVLGASDDGLITASSDGWQILGLSWYWWLGIGALLISAGVMGKRRYLSTT